MIRSTKSTAEADKIYTTKLSLSAGRCILRPQYETELTIQDRTPGLFLADMIEHYEDVFPPLLEKKKQQADRVLPYRKRTALVDERISRSDLSKDFDPQELLAQQNKQKHSSQEGGLAPVLSSPETSQIEIPKRESSAMPEVALAADNVPVASPLATTSPLADDFKTPLNTPPNEPLANPIATTPAPAAESSIEPVAPTASGRTTPSRSSVHSVVDEAFSAPGTGLKRNTSSETSRLRGPKGARGPRPAPGHSSRGSVSKIAAQFENGGK